MLVLISWAVCLAWTCPEWTLVPLFKALVAVSVWSLLPVAWACRIPLGVRWWGALALSYSPCLIRATSRSWWMACIPCSSQSLFHCQGIVWVGGCEWIGGWVGACEWGVGASEWVGGWIWERLWGCTSLNLYSFNNMDVYWWVYIVLCEVD